MNTTLSDIQHSKSEHISYQFGIRDLCIIQPDLFKEEFSSYFDQMCTFYPSILLFHVIMLKTKLLKELKIC